MSFFPHPYPDAFDASPGDLLTVIELDALQTVAVLQVLEGHVGDQGAVVQLHHREALLATGAAAQSSDAVVCDQLAVRQGLMGAERNYRRDSKNRATQKLPGAYQCLEPRAVDRQLNQGVICHLRRGQPSISDSSSHDPGQLRGL